MYMYIYIYVYVYIHICICICVCVCVCGWVCVYVIYIQEMDKGGLRMIYAQLAHFSQRLLRHVQCSADNDELKVATLHWLRRRA